MRGARFLLAVGVALAAAGCARQQQTYYMLDPTTGQAVPVVAQPQYGQPQYWQQSYAQPQYAQQSYQQPASQAASAPNGGRGLFSPSPAYAQQAYAQPQYAEQTYQPPAPQPQQYAQSSGRGLFTSRQSVPPVYAQATPQPPAVIQYGAPATP